MSLEDRVDSLIQEVHDLKGLLMEIRQVLPVREYRTIEDISRMFGYSASYIRHSLWIQPNFGKSDYAGKEKRWRIETFDSWFETPEDERRELYRRKILRERRSKTA